MSLSSFEYVSLVICTCPSFCCLLLSFYLEEFSIYSGYLSFVCYVCWKYFLSVCYTMILSFDTIGFVDIFLFFFFVSYLGSPFHPKIKKYFLKTSNFLKYLNFKKSSPLFCEGFSLWLSDTQLPSFLCGSLRHSFSQRAPALPRFPALVSTYWEWASCQAMLGLFCWWII